MMYVLGVDGGGTHTCAWLADAKGTVLGRSEAGPSNPLKVGLEEAGREIERAVRLARRKARLPQAQLEAVCVGLAGTDRAPIHRRMFARLRRTIPACHHLLTSDAAIALEAAIGDSAGIMVIAGTGSIAYGRNERGEVLRSGGWGHVFDDAGSGYDVGRRAIVASLRALDGRGPSTRLQQDLCRSLGLRNLTEVILKEQKLSPAAIAALFPLVLAASRRRDRVAIRLCEEAAQDLADLALALIERFHWLDVDVPVICSGGVFQASARVYRNFSRQVHTRAPKVRIRLLSRLPVEGAVKMACKLVLQKAAKTIR